MEGRLTLEALTALVETGEIDTVMVAAVDMQGRLVGKRLHARYFLSHGHREAQGCGAVLATDIANAPIPGLAGSGDCLLRPDVSTLRRAAWLPRTALVLAELHDPAGSAPVAYGPRQVLKAQVARAREAGFEVGAATELQFAVFDGPLARNGVLPPEATGVEPLLQRLRSDLAASGVPVEGTRHGAASRPHELNIRYGTAMDAAEHHVIAKHAAKEIAVETGHSVSFLPKWHPERPGSASHIHLSLWTGREPAFFDSSLPNGLARLARAFLGGMIRGLDEMSVFLAPQVNSYKRLQPGRFDAPTRKLWSTDDRTAAFRLRGQRTGAVRIECRVPGADVNPYLAIAALLAAGLDGIAQHLDCGEPAEGVAQGATGAHVARTLRDAIHALRGSAMLRTAMGDAVVDHYVRAAEWEQAAFDASVTDWEIARGFDRS